MSTNSPVVDVPNNSVAYEGTTYSIQALAPDTFTVLIAGVPVGRIVYTFGAANVPTLAVPMGFTSERLPLSLQIAARPFAEETVYRIGHAYESATDWHARHPDLARTLSAFQRETCHQLMVVTVNSLEGRSLEGFALHYASRIGLGYHRLNNGLMLLVVPSTRQTRIQVGCGLEDVISDAQATEILQRDLLPNAREGQWTDALRASLSSLMQLARNKPIPESYRPDGCRAGAGKVTK